MKLTTAVFLTCAMHAASVTGMDDTIIIETGNQRLEGTHALTPEDNVELGKPADGKFILATELFLGGVKLVDVENESWTYIVDAYQPPLPDGATYPGGVGVTYTKQHIFVASGFGGPNMVYVYNTNGVYVGSCTTAGDSEPGIFNDIEVAGDRIYVTDSVNSRLYFVDLPNGIEGNADNCILQNIILEDELFKGVQCEGDLRANGIVSYGEGLIVAVYSTGGLVYVDEINNIQAPIPGAEIGTLCNPDGLELVEEANGKKRLYVTAGCSGSDRVGLGNIVVFRIEEGSSANGPPNAILEGMIENSAYDSPATSAIIGNMIYTANARFATAPEFGSEVELSADYIETFNIIGSDRFLFRSKKNRNKNHKNKKNNKKNNKKEKRN